VAVGVSDGSGVRVGVVLGSQVDVAAGVWVGISVERGDSVEVSDAWMAGWRISPTAPCPRQALASRESRVKINR
jgi:hypothetical protein